MKVESNVFDITKSVMLIAVCFVLIYKFWNYEFNNNHDRGLDETTVTKIAENIVKAQVVESNKRLDTLIEEFKKQNSIVIDEIENKKEEIVELGRVISSLQSEISEMKSNFIFKDNENPKKDVDFTQVSREASNGESFPTADIYYSPNLDSDNRWTINTHPLKFYTTVVETETKDGFSNRYVELNVENRRIPSLRGKLFPIKIDDFVWEKKEIKDKSFDFNPRLSFGATCTNECIYPNIGISLFSYGRTYRDINFRFLTIAAGGDNDKLSLGLTPVSYNLGEFIPLVENLFLGPNVSINTDNDISYGGDLSVPF
jgi:hypothetical protein